MKERDDWQSSDPSKPQKGRSKKCKPTAKLYVQSCWPKVMISRDDRTCKRTEKPSGTTCLSFLEGSAGKLQGEERDGQPACDVEHLCCEESGTNFEEEQGVCLISSSSEISGDLEETLTENGKGEIEEPAEESGPDCSAVEGVISGTGHEERPIFVDLTTDEKNTWKQNILKRFCDVNSLARVNEEEDGSDSCSTSVVLEPRIMIADSSSKVNCTGGSSLATALRDHGPCLIPVQPNRSLPIRPAPLVPTRLFRKDYSSLMVPSNSTNLDVVEVEPAKPIGVLSEVIQKEKDAIADGQACSKGPAYSTSSLHYVIPRISGVGSPSRMKKKLKDDAEPEKSNAKEAKKKRRSQEADSSQAMEECVESSIKEFLKNFCGSNETGGARDSCTDKCARVVSTTNEETGGKVVPPLRLKKVVRPETERCCNSQIATGSEHELNYRIITGTTPRPPPSPIPGSWNNMLYEKDATLASLRTDSYKLKYRRNRLKQKLCELRGKALNLAKEMANDTGSQQSTRLRQMMNRYEKQIENLSKLHSKLSADLSVSNEVIDVNDDEYLFASMNETSNESVKSGSPVSSPEPPKLSPRSPLDYESLLPVNVRDSPPTLPRVCLAILSSQDSMNEELQVSERKVWSVDEHPIQPSSESPLQSSSMDEASPNFKEPMGMADETQKDDTSVDVGDSDANASTGSLGSPKVIELFQSNATAEEKYEGIKLVERFSSSHLMGQEVEKIKCHGYSGSVPVISSVTSGLEAAASVRAGEMFEEASGRQVPSSGEQLQQAKSHGSSRDDVSFEKVSKGNRSAQRARPPELLLSPVQTKQQLLGHKLLTLLWHGNWTRHDTWPGTTEMLPTHWTHVQQYLDRRTGILPRRNVTSTTSQLTQFDSVAAMPRQQQFSLPQTCKGEKMSNDSAQRSNRHSITEQFPTLGNWVARMSKKQTAKTKSKLQSMGNVPFVPAETASRIPRPEMQKIIGSTTTNNMASTTAKSGMDRWQYYHQQQQRQQLLQQVAASVSLPQPVPTVPPLRPGLYPPISMSQFYPNNYTIDPCNATGLSYYSAICPYGSYPYYSRLHPGSLPGYHFPMQESLRPLQYMDKRFPSVPEHMVKYPAPSTSNLQHTSNLNYDRLRGNSTGNNVGVATCLPSLFLPPPSLSSSPQTLPRAPLTGYPTNGQFSRNRMIPDVVAAAAAAAVVAAASFDRQRGNALACNRPDATGMINVIDRDAHVPDPSKIVINRNVANQTQNSNFSEESHEERARYQQVQNFLFDRLALVKTADNFVQASTVAAGNDTRSVMTPIASTTPYRMSLTPTQHTSLSKNTSLDELRNCETPHLGKVNRSPNSLYNLACSNCGATGPKFKCLGCEMVFYCDERCQEKHWNVHVQWCPKKMPKLKKVT